MFTDLFSKVQTYYKLNSLIIRKYYTNSKLNLMKFESVNYKLKNLTMMKDNETNAVWKKFCEDLERDEHEEEFVRLTWPHLLDDAA